MEIYLKNEKDNYTLIDTQHLGNYKYGTEGRVYNYNDFALKVHWNKVNPRYCLDEKTAKLLLTIDTQRILLPRNTIYVKNKNDKYLYKGYATKYINNIKPLKDITTINSLKLLEELELLYEDCNILTQNNIILYDLDYEENILYNGEIYFVDPGKYLTYEYDDLGIINIKTLNSALSFHIFFLQNNYEFMKHNTKEIINEYLGDFDESEYDKVDKIIKKIYTQDYQKFKKKYNKYYDYILDIIYKYETINKYKAKLIKDVIDKKNKHISEKHSKCLKKIII